MKKKTTEPAKDPIAEYRRLLTICAVQFTRLSDYFANNPSATLPDKNRTTALRLMRDTTQAGDAVRLSIAATSAGLAEELRDKQADLKSEMARLLAKMDCPSAALLAASANIVQSTLDGITELLPNCDGAGKAEVLRQLEGLKQGQDEIANKIGCVNRAKMDKRLQLAYARKLYKDYKGLWSEERVATEVVVLAEVPDGNGKKHIILDGYKPTEQGIKALARRLRRNYAKQR